MTSIGRHGRAPASQAFLLLLIIASGAGLTVLPTVSHAQAAETANTPTRASIGGRFMLQAHDGKVMTDHDFRGQFMLITFGYTWCPDICPMALSTMSDALEELGKEAEKVVPIFVSVDPKRDTVGRLDDYVDHFHPRLIGLTGPKPMVDKTAERYKVKYAMVPDKDGDPDGYTVDHTASVYLMGPEGEFRVKFMYNIDPEDMAARIGEALAQ